ncbi:MAG: hypothetical protein IAE79_06745 [Anaerolinea sp.]|nr:hypothetical protein [Anaerolinea sp.]
MTNYHAYLIRLWREDKQQPWRAELVSPQSGEARRFATPQQAYAYLQQKLEQEREREEEGPSRSRSR